MPHGQPERRRSVAVLLKCVKNRDVLQKNSESKNNTELIPQTSKLAKITVKLTEFLLRSNVRDGKKFMSRMQRHMLNRW